MKVDIGSDLHFKAGDTNVIPLIKLDRAKVLILAGDISDDMRQSIEIIKKFSQYYEKVYFVDGNHEHYNQRDIILNEYDMINLSSNSNSIIYRNGDFFIPDFKTVDLVGCNGWYDFSPDFGTSHQQVIKWWYECMNDSQLIAKCFPERVRHDDIINLAMQELAGLISCVKASTNDEFTSKIIVVTHTVPVKQGLVGPGHVWYKNNGCWLNSRMEEVIDSDINKKIKLWVFGHTHDKYDFYYRGIRFVCNPRGYHNHRPYNFVTIDLDVESAFGEKE